MRVVEARLAGNGVERDLPHDGLEQDRGRLSPSDAITHHQVTSTAVTVLMFTERRASSSSTAKSASPAMMRRGAVLLAGARTASSDTVTSSYPAAWARSTISGTASTVWLRSSPSPLPSASCSRRIPPGRKPPVVRRTITSAPGLAVSQTPFVQPTTS